MDNGSPQPVKYYCTKCQRQLSDCSVECSVCNPVDWDEVRRQWNLMCQTKKVAFISACIKLNKKEETKKEEESEVDLD